MEDRLNRHEGLLSDVRMGLARLEERSRTIIRMIEEDREAREELAKKLEPVTDSLNRWKGAFAVVALLAGAIGSLATSVFERMFGTH